MYYQWSGIFYGSIEGIKHLFSFMSPRDSNQISDKLVLLHTLGTPIFEYGVYFPYFITGFTVDDAHPNKRTILYFLVTKLIIVPCGLTTLVLEES